MDDLEKYINKRKQKSKELNDSYEEGYQQFKIGVLIQEARKQSGFTQEELAQKVQTKKSAISRIENHAENISLSTLYKITKALGKKLEIKIS
ncbi:MAG: transcriptional regulator [Spirochaetae bacterium HGW-Spirochaetae-6]|nr:MAG: transcriptional regulator [Spirochaetae bacterium HGW-Spirochaetae-6]